MSELKTISGKEIREELDYNTIGVDPDDKEFNGLELAETQYYIKSEADKVIAKLKADYSAEVEELCIEKTNVDTLEQAWKRSQRALWKERADNASRIECMFRTLSDIEDDDTRTYWIFGNKWERVFYHLKCHRMKTAYDWTMIWETVACKCRAMADKYGEGK